MNANGKTDYVKRSQKDYSLSLKLQVVNEIERLMSNEFSEDHEVVNFYSTNCQGEYDELAFEHDVKWIQYLRQFQQEENQQQ